MTKPAKTKQTKESSRALEPKQLASVQGGGFSGWGAAALPVGYTNRDY